MKITFFKVLLTLVLLCGVGNAWGEESYTLIFKSAGSGDGTAIATSTSISNILSDGSDYVSAVGGSNLQSCYYAGSAGLKLGKSGGTGKLELILTNQGKVKATTIVVKAKLYNSSKAAKLSVNNAASQSLSADFKEYTFNINADVTSVLLVSTNYCWINSVTVYYTPTPTTAYTVTFNPGVNGTCTTTSLTETSAGAGITLPSCTANDEYVFKGWSTTENGTTADAGMAGATYKPSSDCTLYAVYKKLYTVTYNSLGEELDPEKVEESGTITKDPSSVAPPTGWTFAGWTTDNSYKSSISAPVMFDVNSPIKANTNLYAVFKKDSGIGTSAWRLVTDANSLAAGDKITFAATKDNKSYASGVFEDKFLSSVTASISDEILTSEEAIEITLGGTSDSWTLTTSEGQVGTTAAKALSLNKSTTWSISIDNSNKATVSAGETLGRILYNVNTPRFLNYTSATSSSMLLPYIFRKESVNYTIYTLNVPLTQSVTITSAGYATACIPFNATVEGATAYYVTVSDDKAQLNEIEGTIPANTGVVLKGAEGTATFTESAEAPTTDVSANKMVGTLTTETFSDANYVYYRLANNNGNVGFYKQYEDGSAYCAQYKAVLAVPTGAGAPSFFTFDDATAINAISNVKTSSVRYNLNGQAVGEDYKGIVIVNGKKMFNK